jgi:hypothetical protein
MSHYADDRQMFHYDEPHHLNGPMWDKVTNVAKKGYHGAGHVVAATGRGAAAVGRGAAAVGRGAAVVGSGILHPSDSYKNATDKYHTWRHGTGNEIDICECSRRVQGHLAIQYPEFH